MCENPTEDAEASDFDEDGANDEPSLGSCGHGNGGPISYSAPVVMAHGKTFHDCEGDEHDGREPVAEDEGAPNGDNEPSLDGRTKRLPAVGRMPAAWVTAPTSRKAKPAGRLIAGQAQPGNRGLTNRPDNRVDPPGQQPREKPSQSPTSGGGFFSPATPPEGSLSTASCEGDGNHIHLIAAGAYCGQKMEATMSKKFVNRITLVSVLSGALLGVSLVLPVHAGHAIPATANQQFGAGNPLAMVTTQSVFSQHQHKMHTHG